MDTIDPLILSQRELQEIQHSLYYVLHCGHGTVGHNLLVLCAKLALDRGFALGEDLQTLVMPDNVRITEKGV